MRLELECHRVCIDSGNQVLHRLKCDTFKPNDNSCELTDLDPYLVDVFELSLVSEDYVEVLPNEDFLLILARLVVFGSFTWILWHF